MKKTAGALLHAFAAPDEKGNACQVAAVSALLLLAVGLVFGQTVHHEFIDLDDTAYVSLNPHLTSGLSVEAVKWAFTDRHLAAWIPLTSISHMLAFQVLGPEPGGHHLINVLLHATTAVLLFLVLRQMTGRLWASAFAAAVFAVHPLRVESVAWVVERKDVLSGLFFVLALGAYVRYVRRPFSLVRYATLIVLFALGLMSKPMLVTLPFVLLLLDYWPLGRWHAAIAECPSGAAPLGAAPQPGFRPGAAAAFRSRWGVALRLVLEKLPLFALAAVSCFMTVWAFGSEGSDLIAVQKDYPLSWRIGNGLIAYVSYLGMFFYPANLAIPYPAAGPDLPTWKVVGAVFFLVAITLAALIERRRRPYLLVGWLWYLGMLAPTSGVLQYAVVSKADRFTYLPEIGLCLALVWALADGLRAWPRLRPAWGAAAALLLVILMGCAWRQTSFWRDNLTLWNHTLACTSRNSVAHHALGNALLGRGEIDKAIAEFQAAIAIQPDFPMSHYNLGVALAAAGRLDEAIAEYEKAVELQPENPAAHNNLANALLTQGQLDRAMSHCRQALQIDPHFAEAHYNAGSIWHARGRIEDAIAAYRQALEAKPDFGEARFCLGLALARRGQLDDAIAEYRRALETQPYFAAEVHNALGLALAARGRLDEAVAHYREALAIRPDFAEARHNLETALRGRRSDRKRTDSEGLK